MKDRVLVTGGAGYIGAHVCLALSQAGYEPVTFDDFSMGHKEHVLFGPATMGSILDSDALNQAMQTHSPIGVIHLAGKTLVGESMTRPGLYIQHNVAGAANVAEALLNSGKTAFIFSSSCAVYGNPETKTLSENHPKAPVSPYGSSKLLAEAALEELSRQRGLSSIYLRYFNAAGADPKGRIGEWHTPETHLIPLAIEAALGARGPLKIFGDDFPTPDGTAVRDYIHVSDLASAHVLALEKALNEPLSLALNVGTGQGYSVKEVVDAVSTHSKVPYEITGRRAGDPPSLVADARLAHKELGWTPKSSNLHEIIESAYHWHVSKLDSERL